MIMVSISTFNWTSVKELKLLISTNIVMLSTVAVTVYTHNLAMGVLTGVVINFTIFLQIKSHTSCTMKLLIMKIKLLKTYKFVGQVFLIVLIDFMK